MSINPLKHWTAQTLALALWAGVTAAPVYAQQINEPDTLQANRDIDLYMNRLHGPIWQPVWFLPGDAPGALPGSPIYKQEPLGSQEDFRPPPVVVVPTPVTPPPSSGGGKVAPPPAPPPAAPPPKPCNISVFPPICP